MLLAHQVPQDLRAISSPSLVVGCDARAPPSAIPIAAINPTVSILLQRLATFGHVTWRPSDDTGTTAGFLDHSISLADDVVTYTINGNQYSGTPNADTAGKYRNMGDHFGFAEGSMVIDHVTFEAVPEPAGFCRDSLGRCVLRATNLPVSWPLPVDHGFPSTSFGGRILGRIFAVLAIAVVTCGVAFAQDAEEEANVEYEKLKVLEPLLGTWRIDGENQDTGAKWEGFLTPSWSETRKMVVVHSIFRFAEAGDDLSKQEWYGHPTCESGHESVLNRQA